MKHQITVFFCLVSAYTMAQRNYYEDLSFLRPRVQPLETTSFTPPAKVEPVAATPVYDVTKEVNTVLDSISRFNLTRKFVDGVIIQIYSGAKKEEALNARKRLSEQAGDLTGNLTYQQPKFRVTVGAYYTTLEAQKDFQRLKRIFPNAILIPEKIPFR